MAVILSETRENMKNMISIREFHPSNSILGYSYNELLIESGEYIKVHSYEENTDKIVGPFLYVDDYHFSLNGRTFHCDEYGEILYRNNCRPFRTEEKLKKEV